MLESNSIHVRKGAPEIQAYASVQMSAIIWNPINNSGISESLGK